MNRKALGKGINALRRPTEFGLQRYGEGTIREIYEKYIRSELSLNIETLLKIYMIFHFQF